MKKGPIGIFDSGYGGLTVMKEIVNELPAYDYIYLGDNARTPYGTRSYETIYEYTLECVKYLFDQGCHLIILACNTASAKALRTIQQRDLPNIAPDRRVLGVIRPTAEVIGNLSKTKHVGVLGTSGTIQSDSYKIEIEKHSKGVVVYQHACPMWVPLVENGEYDNDGADYFVEKDLKQILIKSDEIDTILLGCTHYPLLLPKIQKYLPKNVSIISQGGIVAKSLKDYLERHPEIKDKCTARGKHTFLTTDSADNFDFHAEKFFAKAINSNHIRI